MLERLIEFGFEENFFEIQPLGQLPASCCSTPKTLVIDFDKTKARISEESRLQQPKSADALKIITHLNRIDFIELKGFEMFIKNAKNPGNKNKTVTSQIEKFNLPKKIKDSLFLLHVLINCKKFHCSNQELAKFEQVIKGYIVVIDIELKKDPVKDRLATLTFLSENHNLKEKILTELNNFINCIPESSLENLAKPRIFNCNTIDGYYAEII